MNLGLILKMGFFNFYHIDGAKDSIFCHFELMGVWNLGFLFYYYYFFMWGFGFGANFEDGLVFFFIDGTKEKANAELP